MIKATSVTSLEDVRDALLPKLQPYLHDGGTLRHPLIIEPGVTNCDEANRITERYQQLAARQKELRANPGDGWQYVFLHGKPYRFTAFQQIAARLEPRDYWKLLSEVWIGSENIRQHFTGWLRLWSDLRPHKQECMTPEERATLEDMPARFAVWRGVGFRGRVHGLSWTVDRDKAVWFARRGARSGHHLGRPVGNLIQGKVERRKVHAYFDRRKEFEIVAADVKVLEVEKGITPRASRLPSA